MAQYTRWQYIKWFLPVVEIPLVILYFTLVFMGLLDKPYSSLILLTSSPYIVLRVALGSLHPRVSKWMREHIPPTVPKEEVDEH
jgi:hypothetical protein